MSIALRDDRRQAMLRNALLQKIGTTKTYQNAIVQDLRPVWKRVQARYWPSRTQSGLYEVFRILDELEYEIGPVDPDLTLYCCRLRSIVSDSFLLRSNNEPAWWALEAFHNHVASGFPPDQPIGIASASFIFSREFEMKVRVTENGASIIIVDHFGNETPRELPSTGPLSFQNWGNLEQCAIGNLQHQIADIRRQFEINYERTGTGHDQIRKINADLEAIPKLVEALLESPSNRLRMTERDRSRFRRILAQVGVDPLVKSSS